MITYFNLTRPASEHLLADVAKGAPKAQMEILSCPITDEHLDGSRRVSELAWQMTHNDRKELLIWDWIEGCVIHQTVLDEFSKRGISGYRLKPATVRFRDGIVSNDYSELVVTGWAGVARQEAGIRLVENCPACHWKRYSALEDVEQLIDWSQWTGEDFFIVWPLPNFVLVTERVAQTLLELQIGSFRLLGLLEDVDPAVRESGFTVSRLSDFLPQDVALKYGKPLGLE